MSSLAQAIHKQLVEEAVERLKREGAEDILSEPRIDGITVDLYAKVGGKRVIVECYTYFKRRILLKRLDVIRRNCDRFIIVVPKGQRVNVKGVEVWYSDVVSPVFVAVHMDGRLYSQLEDASRRLGIAIPKLIEEAVREKLERLRIV